MTEFRTYFGARITESLLWDALDTYFREGGSTAYVQRVAGPAAALAGITLNDADGDPSLRVDAKNAGAWWNGVTVAVTAGAAVGEFALVIANPEFGVERSPSLASVTDAINWSNSSSWAAVSLPTGASGADPAVVAAANMTGGADDYAAVDDVTRGTALARFTRGLGPGQVWIPGATSTNTRGALRTHAKEHNRIALLDDTDTSSATAAGTEAQSLQGDEYAALFGPWHVVPGLLGGTTRQVPPTAMAAALMARNDQTRSANNAAAGVSGRARYVVGLTQSGWSDAEREALNTNGLNVFRELPAGVTLYGYRTLAKPGTDAYAWSFLANQRLRMAITAEAETVAETFLFRQVDGRGQLLAEFGSALSGVLLRYYNEGALFGETPDEAYLVNVGEQVNTPTTIANGELHAVLSLRMSPTAELVVIEIVKTSADIAL
ncbi:hypothetical protein GTQ99_00215 [Kineococcus sp. T13]|uniref:phage tail sheath subtilisin-like domain-containing protein n=1 Tax=Kineococcus vitellinus TaxID=2696565 RepID=UPI001411EBF4|nr:phage tail sheath subtilisin-like domain-containing protein [Kineococcus vitellinus]NAZ73854.1 hypothetical protein [Kineococcus vitellinus]